MELRLWRSEDSTEQFSITVLHSHSHTCTRTVSLGDDRRRMMERGGGRNEWDGSYDIWVTANTIIPESPSTLICVPDITAPGIGNSPNVPFPFFFIISKDPALLDFPDRSPPPLPFRSPEKREIILTFPSVYYQISIFLFLRLTRHHFPPFHDSTIPRVSRASIFSPIHKFAIDSLLVEKYMG